MSVTVIITMGSISVGCAITEKVLSKLGKSDEAQMVNITGLSMLGVTAIACVIKIFSEMKKLG